MNTEKIYKFITERCKPFLEQIDYDLNEYTMWRGVSYKLGTQLADNNMIFGRTRLGDRKPRTSSVLLHDWLNKSFIRYYGKMWRNGLFVTGDKQDAARYGDIAAVFPIGAFEFLWSPEIQDLYMNLRVHAPHLVDADIEDAEFVHDVTTYAETQVMGKYKKDDLKSAIKSGNEIMVWVDQYAMVDYEWYTEVFLPYYNNHQINK